VILWQLFAYRWLHVRLAFWSALVTWSVRSQQRSWQLQRRPGRVLGWLWRHTYGWNARRTAVVFLLTNKRGRWLGGTAHPTQQRLEPDPHRNPGWWKEWS
jgi:hypothetical protein